MNTPDLIGQAFGRWTVISHAAPREYKPFLLCRCACGATGEVKAYELLRGMSQSCGCKNRDELRAMASTHLMSQSKEYRTWADMKARCDRETCTGYRHYGGRGITYDPRWANFEEFYQDMGPRPSVHHSLDRIDVNGNYESSNCQWATGDQQRNNTRRSHYLTYEGKTLTVRQWADLKGMNYLTLLNRINTYHWTVDEALETPVRPPGREYSKKQK